MQGEQAVWDNLVTWLSTTTSKPAVQECAVAVLAVVADRILAPNLQLRSPQLWSLPVLQQGWLAAGSAHLICAAYAQGATMSLKLVCSLCCDLTVTDSIPCRLANLVWCIKRLGQQNCFAYGQQKPDRRSQSLGCYIVQGSCVAVSVV